MSFFSSSSKQGPLNKGNLAKSIRQLGGRETSFSLIVPLLCDGLEDQGNVQSVLQRAWRTRRKGKLSSCVV